MLTIAATLALLLHLVRVHGVMPLEDHEPIIADGVDVLGGVLINNNYTDHSISSDLPPGGRPSAPGCPKNEGGYPWLYHNDSRCYLAGTSGPCDSGEYWYSQNNSDFGVCYCRCLEKTEFDAFDVINSVGNPDKLCGDLDGGDLRVFSTSLNKCLLAFEQGPCKADEWLAVTPVMGRTRVWAGRSFCEKRRCGLNEIPKDPEQSGNITCGSRIISFASITAPIEPEDCGSGLKYSDKLKMCLSNNKVPLKGIIG